jgi:antitoxin component YwqK of YwqJK toxin-antitoxin module
MHKQWHSNGELFTLKNFKTGLEHGEQKSWDQNGELMYKYIYNNGRKYGIQGSIICNGGNELEALN